MKKSLLLAAALFATTAAFGQTYRLVGGNINGSENWDAASASTVMSETTSNVYEWSGTQLGNAFKITVDGTWDNAVGAGSGELTVGTPYSFTQGNSTADIIIGGNCDYVQNPKVVLDMNAKTVTVTGTVVEKEPVDPNELTLYMIGSNVNGHSWELAQEDCKFTNMGGGVFEWKGEILGTGFKVNDGTWGNADYNFGSTSGNELTLGEPYYYWANGSSGNIAFAGGFTEVNNPTVTLNLNDATITVTGDESGVATWYITGINSQWELTEDWELAPVEGKDGIFGRDVYVVETAATLKVSDNGWAHQYGTNLPEEVFVDADHMTVQLEPVDGEGGNVPYELEEGSYYIEFDLNELILTVKNSADNAVEAVVVGNDAKAVYYNLNGQKVLNPDRGIFVKVVNGKAVKVVK